MDLARACSQLRSLLESRMRSCRSRALLLSGGLDTSVLAGLLAKYIQPISVTVIFDPEAPDGYFSRKISKELNFPHLIWRPSPYRILEAARKCIRISRCFDWIELRNQIPIYLGMSLIKQLGLREVITGDGGDEIFLGYSYLVEMDHDRLMEYLPGFYSKLRFASIHISRELGLRLELPYLDPNIMEFGVNLPIEYRIGEYQGTRWGKLVLRLMAQDVIPQEIAWRPKHPIELGSGAIKGVEEVISRYITPSELEELSSRYKLRSRVQYGYLKLYLEIFGELPQPQPGQMRCEFCGAGKSGDFCRLCGNTSHHSVN